MHIVKSKKPVWKSTYGMIPTIWYYWKCKTAQMINISVADRDWGKERDEEVGQDIFSAVKLWYCNSR
jgi:hypothetical protein